MSPLRGKVCIVFGFFRRMDMFLRNGVIGLVFFWGETLYAKSPVDFADYAVKSTCKESVSKVNLNSHPKAKRFKTRLRHLIGSKANYAGCYAITSWGCGTACQQVAMVHVRSGNVLFVPKTSSTGYIAKPNSRLLVVDPIIEDPSPPWLVTHHYVLDAKEEGFRLVAEKPRKK